MKMKKSVLVVSLTALLIFSGLNLTNGQEQPKPKKDTVNMDTDAKPKFYYPVEDEKANTKDSSKSGLPVIAIIGGAAVVAGVVGFILIKKKKQ
jgi:DNA/RNA endonuclease YhcR with UshA esterase domain